MAELSSHYWEPIDKDYNDNKSHILKGIKINPMKKYFFLYLFFTIVISSNADNLIINEIQVANIDRFIDPSYNYGGWIEIYNPNSQSISLSGMKVRHTDSNNLVETYTLTSDHGSVAAKGYSCLWFDHNSQDGYYGPYAKTQIRYKLDADGGKIELLNSSGTVLSSVSYPAAIARCSYLRKTDGSTEWSFTSEPTPGKTNNNTSFATKRLDAPKVSTDARVFTSSFSFQVTIPQQATLYYSTDGSTPIPGKSAISQDGNFTVKETIIYRFLLAREGYLNSKVVTRTFIKNTAGYTLPIVSVSTHPDNLFDNKIGVYVRGTNGRVDHASGTKANQNMDWERPVNFEYIVPDKSSSYKTEINQEVSFKIFGGWSRFEAGNDEWEERPSFKLKAEKQYEGINEIPYPIFSSKPHIKLKSILVRNGGQNQSSKIKDASIQELVRTSGFYVDGQAWQPTHVFLNGKYLGMLNLREESNKRFAYSNYGIDSEEIDQWENNLIINEGNNKKFTQWLDLCNQLAKKPSDQTIWEKIKELVDIDEFCNYFALETFIGNGDWFNNSKFNNIKWFCSRNDRGKFHFVLFDTDIAFNDDGLLSKLLNDGKNKFSKAFTNMLLYEPFQKQFIDAISIIYGSIFSEQRVRTIINKMVNQVEPALSIEGLSAIPQSNVLIKKITNPTVYTDGFFSIFKKNFHLSSEYDIKLSAPSAIGHRFLLNGQEIPTGEFDGKLFAPIKLTAIAPAGYQFDSWVVDGKALSQDSILNFSELKNAGTYSISARFKANPQKKTPPVRINEVSAGNDIYINDYGKKEDFIELYNTTDKDINLAGCFLSDKAENPLKYKISGGTKNANTIIPAHGYKIVWCDKKEPDTQLHASFKLDNADGAFISITAADGSWSDHLEYKAQDRWYTFGRYPDGGDDVALLRRPTIDNPNHICYDTELWPYNSNFEDPKISTYKLSISEVGWGTICVPFAFSVPKGLIIYTVEDLMSDGCHLSLKQVSAPAANKPYLVQGPTGNYTLSGTYVKGDNSKTDYLANGLLRGVLSDTFAPAESYVLQCQENAIGFYHVSRNNDISILAHHAYLKTTKSKAAIIHLPEDPSDIDYISNISDEQTIIYNLSGKQIKNIHSSGIYLLRSADGSCQRIQINPSNK